MRQNLLVACAVASLIGGLTWSQTSLPTFAIEENRVNDVAPGSCPRLASDQSGALHVAFELAEHGAKSDIFYTQSSDLGVHWTAPLNISVTPARSTHADIAVESKGAIDIVWLDSRSGETRPDVFISRSSDGGKTWSAPLDVSNTPGISGEPNLAIGPNNQISVIWIDTTSGVKRPDVYYSESSDNAKTWSAAANISDTPGVSSHPTIAVDADNTVHVAWKDTTSGETRPDIFYLSKSGATWSRPPLDVSGSARISDYPSIA